MSFNRNTIMRLLLEMGKKCEALALRKLTDLHVRRIQADEIWCYVAKKEKRVTIEDSYEAGDQWVFVALDADTKLVFSWVVGKRSVGSAFQFMRDVFMRLSWGARPQITTDGFGPYVPAIAQTFGI